MAENKSNIQNKLNTIQMALAANISAYGLALSMPANFNKSWLDATRNYNNEVTLQCDRLIASLGIERVEEMIEDIKQEAYSQREMNSYYILRKLREAGR